MGDRFERCRCGYRFKAHLKEPSLKISIAPAQDNTQRQCFKSLHRRPTHLSRQPSVNKARWAGPGQPPSSTGDPLFFDVSMGQSTASDVVCGWIWLSVLEVFFVYLKIKFVCYALTWMFLTGGAGVHRTSGTLKDQWGGFDSQRVRPHWTGL